MARCGEALLVADRNSSALSWHSSLHFAPKASRYGTRPTAPGINAQILVHLIDAARGFVHSLPPEQESHLLARLLAGESDASFTFAEAELLLLQAGFVHEAARE